MNKKVIIVIATLTVFAGIFLLAKNFYQTQTQEKIDFLANQDASIFVRDHSPRYGNPEAKVYLIEFLDPECESCRAFYPLVKQLLAQHPDKVQLVVRYAPFHHNSVIAIRALEAARKQNKYWEALELLFEKQPQWGDHQNPRPELIFNYLQEMGLNMDQLRSDMLDPSIQTMLMQDMEDLKKLEVRATPTFFVNGKGVSNFSFENLNKLLEEEITKAY